MDKRLWTALLLTMAIGCRRSPGVPGPLSDREAKELLVRILPEEEWQAIGPMDWYSAPVHNTLWWDTTVSISSRMSEVQLTLESPVAMRLRHKIEIGTDLRDWTILLRETTHPENLPFRRVYVLSAPADQPGTVKGLVFYEGAQLEFDGHATAGSPELATFEHAVRGSAARLEAAYVETLHELAEDLEHDGIPERSDLPDPDLTR